MREEIFIKYICHPSMANNELSDRQFLLLLQNGYRNFLSEDTLQDYFYTRNHWLISYLSKNYKYLQKHVVAGFNVTCIGDERSYSYLPSRNGKTLSDVVAKHVLKWIDKIIRLTDGL